MVGGGGETDVARAEAARGRDDGFAGGEILAGAADVAAGLHRFPHDDAVAVALGVLLDQHAVRAGAGSRCR